MESHIVRAMSGAEDASYKVELNIYDLSKGIAKLMSPTFLGKEIEGIWHTGVVAYGREYYFGSGGIDSCRPGGTVLGEPDRVEDLGNSQVPYQLFLEYIFGLGESSFKPGVYDLIKHNCNNFSEEVAEFLCGRGIPKNILTLPDEILNTDLGKSISLVAKTLQLKASGTKTVSFGQDSSALLTYVPRDIPSHKEDPELDELNSAIEEVRNNTLLLENRRSTLNEKLQKKERKDKKKEKREKKKKKKRKEDEEQPTTDREPRRRTRRSDSLQIAAGDIVTEPSTPLPPPEALRRRCSEPTLLPVVEEVPISPTPSPTPPTDVSDEGSAQSATPPSERLSPPPSLPSRTTNMDSEELPPEDRTTPPAAPPDVEEDVAAETPREPPIVFKEEVDTIADFDGFVNCVAEMLSNEEQLHMEELRAYVIEDEGSWSLGEEFYMLFNRIFHDPSIPPDAQRHLVRIMAAAALKDDVILMLHQDRKDHTIMNYANKIESLPPDIQEALALFFCNMFEHLSPSEWLLYISEWAEGNQQVSNIRVTTKVAVNALLHGNPKVQEYGTALMYNLGTKEVKTVVFDDVAPELAMAILQYFGCNPPEEFIWRVMTALCRFCYASSEVPALIKMIGPDPNSYEGMSERVDHVLEEINGKLSRVRGF